VNRASTLRGGLICIAALIASACSKTPEPIQPIANNVALTAAPESPAPAVSDAQQARLEWLESGPTPAAMTRMDGTEEAELSSGEGAQ
jgi:hypothetical protein